MTVGEDQQRVKLKQPQAFHPQQLTSAMYKYIQFAMGKQALYEGIYEEVEAAGSLRKTKEEMFEDGS